MNQSLTIGRLADAPAQKTKTSRGLAFTLPATLLLVLVFLAPVGFVLMSSVYKDGAFTAAGLKWLTGSTLFVRVLWTTLQISVMSSLVSLVLGYALAFHLSRLSARKRAIGLMFVLLPFWTSILVKSYAFTMILGRDGLINHIFAWFLGFNPEFPMIFNRFGVMVGMSNYLIPFIVFPLLANLLAQDRNLVLAAAIMGARPSSIFLRVTLPLSMPAILAGSLMCLIISFGFFVTPALLGGRSDIMLANLIDLFTRETLNWPVSSTIAVVLLLVSLAIVVVLSRVPGKNTPRQ
jgi:putative spermidine/putrescine transport system permease protein